MIIDFDSGYRRKIIVALGFFDSVHRGHRVLINRAKDLAQIKGIESAVFTFAGNLYKAIGFSDNQIYTFRERVDLIYRTGVDHIISAVPDDKFMFYSPVEFLENLTRKYDIDTIVCGNDYSFGRDAAGDIELLRDYCNNKNINLEIIDMILDKGIKISSSNIKKLIAEGNIVEANNLLGAPYMIMGDVVKGKGKGRQIGFPTANIYLPDDKLKLNEGVYATSIMLEGKQYDSLTNVGSKPTFDDMAFNIETYVLGFKQALYGQEIKIYFFDRIRSITKYENMEELSLQIKFDVTYSQSIKRSII